MDLLRRKSQSRRSKIHNNLGFRNDHSTSNALDPDQITATFVRNGIIQDDDMEDEDDRCLGNSRMKISGNTSNSNSYSYSSSYSTLTKQCQDGKSSIDNSDVDVTSCKPCSVILERLPEKEVEKLLSRSNLGVRKNSRKNRRPKNLHLAVRKLHRYARATDGGYSDSKKLEADRNSTRIDSERLKKSAAGEKPDEVLKGNNSSDEIFKSNNESHANSSDRRIKTSRHLSKSFNNSCSNEACEPDTCGTTSQVEDSGENKGSWITDETSKSEVLRPKQFRLSLKMSGIANTKDCSTQIARTENSEKFEDVYNRTSQTEDINAIDGSLFSSDDSEIKELPRKHFKLSLGEKRNSTKDDVACGKYPTSKVFQLEDLDEVIEGDVLELNHLKRLIKRRKNDTENDEAPVSKLKKLGEKKDSPSHDPGKVEEFDSLAHESSVSKSPPDQKSSFEGPWVLDSRRSKQKIDSRGRNKAQIVRNLRVSLVKLEHKANQSISEQDNNVKALDTHEPVDDGRTQILETRPQDLGQSCSNKTKDTKITDYFFKINKQSVVSKSNSKNLNQGARDLLLKKKYGISKNPILLLIDFKKFKIPRSKYLASEVEQLTQEYINSCMNINFASTTNALASSLSPSNHFLSSFNESSTSNAQLSTDLTNLMPVDHPHDSSQTHTIPMVTNLSPKVLRSRLVKRSLPVTKASINDEQTSTVFTNVLSVHDHASKSSHDAIHIQTVPISENLSSPGQKSPLAKNSLTETTCGSLNTGDLESEKEKELSNNKEHVKDYSLGNEDLDINQEVLSRQNSSKLRTTPHSSPKNSVKRGSQSSDSPMKNATPKSSKTLNVELRKLALSPERRIASINYEIPSNESQVQVAGVKSKSPKTIRTPKKSDPVSRTDFSDGSPCGKELQKKSNDNSVAKEDSNTAKCQPDTHPDSSSVIKSPMNTGISRTHSKHEGLRRLPLNSMTILSLEMMEANGSWMDLDNTTDNLTIDSTTAEKNHTIEGSESLDIPPSDNSTKDKTRTETCSSEVSASTESGIAEKEKIDDVMLRNSLSETETSVLNIPGMLPIPFAEDPIDPILVERIDQEFENANAEDQLLTDSQQGGQLLIDTDESDSESRPVEDVVPGTSSSSCLNSSLDVAVHDEDACKEKSVSSKKKCVICKKTFKKLSTLALHLKVHVRDTVGCCLFCDQPLTKTNAIEHYLEHSGCSKYTESGFHSCFICKMKFEKRTALLSHMKFKHDAGRTRLRSKVDPTSANYNKCTICQVTYNSKEELFSHVLKHTPQELQNSFAVEKAKLDLRSDSNTICQKEDSNTLDKGKTQDKEQSSESPQANDILPTALPPNARFDICICMCHKDERLEISGGVIIEIAITCMECKTFFKTRKCFKDHYNSTSCKWSNETVVAPTMFCNKCCTILNNLQDMHGHLTQHGDVDVDTKTSVYCKHCNIFFFGIGSLFYAHWSEHRKNPLFLADHYSFPKNLKVKIVELGGSAPAEEDEPTESLFIAEHQCYYCEKPFQTEEELKKHVKSSDSCSKKVDFNSRVIENSKSVFKLICSICDKEFIDKVMFNSHIEEHDTIKDLIQGPKSLDKSSENGQVTCSICRTEYDTITSYKQHLIRHEVIQEKFLCNCCPLMMGSIEDFERHSVQHEGTSEEPVSCKVIFVINKFHCKVCKIWLDDQSALDEHLATHNNSLTPSSRIIENLPTEIVPAIEKKSHVCATCQQSFDDQLKLDDHVAVHEKNPLSHSIEDPILIHLSDDSNSTDIEILATKINEKSENPVVGNTLLKEQQEIANTQEPKKPAFLRVKNLKELLPYACSKCKAEFETKDNLIKHVCIPDVEPTQDREFNYFCKICKSFPCDNDSDWNLHVLSHFPLQCSQKFSDTWYHVLKMQCEQQVFRCKFCPNYDSSTIYTMRRHFMASHPDIYHPIFKCRVCNAYKTSMEEEIRRHETAHFQQPSPLQPLVNFANNLLAGLVVENSNNSQQPVLTPSVTSSGNNTSLSQPAENLITYHQTSFLNSGNNLPPPQQVENSNNFQQEVLSQSVIISGNKSPSVQSLRNSTDSQPVEPTLQPDNNSNEPQQPSSSPSVTSLGNNLPSLQALLSSNKLQQPNQLLQPDDNSKDLQQSSSIPSVTNSNIVLPSIPPADNSNNPQRRLWIPPVISSIDNLSSLQPLQSFNKSQGAVGTLQPNNNSNNFQLSIPISSVIIPGGNSSAIQPVDNSNKFQQSVTNPQVTSSASNLPSLQSGLKYFINSRQPSPTVQLDNNPKSTQQSISTPTVTSARSSLLPLQPLGNPQWLTTTAQSLQLQINAASAFNNMTNMMHTLPMYVANVIYCCRICKNYKCSTEEELKAHESLHEFIQLGDSAKRLYRCKLCTNIFCSSEDQLRAHMEVCHRGDKSNVSQNQTQSNGIDTQYKCKHCFQTFQSSAQLTHHMLTSHSLVPIKQNNTQFQNPFPYHCQICSIGFLNEAFLQAHMRQLHPNVKLPHQKSNDAKTLYQCDTCGLLLISEATLSYHMRSHNMGFH